MNRTFLCELGELGGKSEIGFVLHDPTLSYILVQDPFDFAQDMFRV